MNNRISRVFLAVLVVVAVGCGDEDEGARLNPLAPSPVAPPVAMAEGDSALTSLTLDGDAPVGRSAMPAGTCTEESTYIRCWHFYPTLVLWVSPNASWARNGTPFVRYLRSGFKVYCDKTIVWSGKRRVYRVNPMRPVTIDGTPYC